MEKVILQEGNRMKIGGRSFRVSPFSLSTLIKVSGLISRLPIYEGVDIKTEEDAVEAIRLSLAMGKDSGEIVADILTTLLMGTRKYYDLFYRIKYWLLKRWVLTLTHDEVFTAILSIINSSSVSTFFPYTTFLSEVNLLKPTKVG